MKNVRICSVLFLVASLPVVAQQTGGGAGGGAAGAAGAGAGAANRAIPPRTISPPGSPTQPPKQNPLAPGPTTDPQLPPGLVPPTNITVVDTNRPILHSTNLFGGVTNRSGMATNQFGINTNQFGVATNQFGLAPSGSNGVLTSATNSAFATNAGGVIGQDQAFSARDQAILAQVRRAIPMQLLPGGVVNGVPSSSSTTTSGSGSTTSGTSGTGSATTSLRNNIHFVVRNGVVTIVGFVPTLAERQRIEAAVAGISGVTQVMDDLRVRTGGDVAVTAADQALLTQLRQAVQPILVPTGTMTPAFSAREGVVTITGTAASQQESQQIEAAVAQIPGVVRVSNQLVAGNAVTGFSLNPARPNSGATNITGSAPLLPNNFNLPITNQVGATTNVLLPTSRRNAPSSVLSSNATSIVDTNTTPTTP